MMNLRAHRPQFLRDFYLAGSEPRADNANCPRQRQQTPGVLFQALCGEPAASASDVGVHSPLRLGMAKWGG